MPRPEASNDDVSGVAVSRWARRPGADDPHWQFAMKTRPDDHVRSDAVPGQWHSLAPEAQAKRREAVEQTILALAEGDVFEKWETDLIVPAVLETLGLST